MKRILIISPSPEWGGASTANISIAKILTNAGYDVTYNDEYYTGDFYKGYPVSHHNIHGKEKGASDFLEKLVVDNDYNTIIWGNVWVLRKYIATVRKFHQKGVNQIAIFHSLSLGTSFLSRVFEYICAQMMRYMDHIVYVSSFTEKSWGKYSIIANNPEKGIIIHNPLEYNGKMHIRESNKPTIGFVGRFSDEKQPNVFCELSKDSDYNYLAFGDGPLLNLMKSIYPTVKFMGNCMDTDLIYENIDILVMTSKFENCPMVLLESKARGIPCVAPDVGGISEIVSDGLDGKLYKDYTNEAILSGITAIANNYDWYSMNCSHRSKYFTSSELIKKWESII